MKWLISILAVNALAACVQVESARITAADLAAAVPALAAMPRDKVFGYAPLPGLMRTIVPAELRRFAQTAGIDVGSAAAVCVEYPARPIEREVLANALSAAFGESGAEIELLDWNRNGVPQGELKFDRRNLVPAPGGMLLWRGQLLYRDRRAVPMWARLHVTVRSPRLIAAREIQPGQKVTPEDVRIDSERRPFTAPRAIASQEAVIGRSAVRRVPAGAELQPAWFTASPVVHVGEMVEVTVERGAAMLRFEAKSVQSAFSGQLFALVNPLNGKQFKATAIAAGKAIVK